MAPQDPPRDDELPETDATQDSPEIEDQGDSPRATSTDSDGAVDAEIVETSEDQDSEELVMASDETADAEETDKEGADEPANEYEPKSGGLAAPFAIILGAIAVVITLMVFLNRDVAPTSPKGDDQASLFAEGDAHIAQPIAYQPVTKPTESVEPTEKTTSTEDIEPTENVDDLPQLNVPNTERVEIVEPAAVTETEEPAANNAEATEADKEKVAMPDGNGDVSTDESTSATVAALVSGSTINSQDTEELAERRSMLIAEAAERNRERREARIDASVERSTEKVATDIQETDVTDIIDSVDDVLPEETSHAETSVSTEVISAAVESNEVTSKEEATFTGGPEAEAPDGSQPTDEQAGRVVTLAPAPDYDEIKADVLAETEQVIEEKLQQTEEEVRALRSELTEQQRVANERLAALTRKIDSLESSEINTARQSTLLLALSDLDNGIHSGEPFIKELDNVERMAPNTRSLASLRDYAAAGLPTDAELRAAYSVTARQALSNAQREEANGPLAQLGANITGLFSVRKVGNVEGDTPSAIIARAEDRLNSGDLEGAVNELENLSGPARDAFSDWMSTAGAKANAQRRIDAMERSITSRAG